MSAPRWGVCATIKASPSDILTFAAYYLQLGAHRVWIYLDAPAPTAMQALKAHPKCRVILCDETYWQRQGSKRPDKHQVRQSRNATRALARATDVDWLLHVDVDEFLVCHEPLETTLATLPASALTARIRPMEALAPQSGEQHTAFKRFIAPGPARQRIVEAVYPGYGAILKGGFLSHVAGKLITRTGQPKMKLRIHNAFQGDSMNPGLVELNGCSLAHLHASDWAVWRAKFSYRHDKGAYRSDLAPVQEDAQNLHHFFQRLLQNEGDAGLRKFFDTVCADTPEHRHRLEDHQLLFLHDLDLTGPLAQEFPGAL